jgi:hypothetical protein
VPSGCLRTTCARGGLGGQCIGPVRAVGSPHHDREADMADQREGDFAAGERTTPQGPQRDFAEGEEKAPPGPERDFAEGEEQASPGPQRDFGEGQEKSRP